MSASSAGTLGVFHPRRLVFDPREDRRLYLFLAAVYVLADRILLMCLKWARIGGRRWWRSTYGMKNESGRTDGRAINTISFILRFYLYKL